MMPRFPAAIPRFSPAGTLVVAAVAAVAALWISPGLLAGPTMLQETYDELGGSEVSVEAVFDAATRSGALPFHVRIANRSDRERTWVLRMREGNHGRTLATESTFSFRVGAGEEVRHEIVFHFAPEFASYSYRGLEFELASPGVRSVSRAQGRQNPSTLPMIGMSQALASRSLSRLDTAAKARNSSDPRFATSFLPRDLPANWIGLTGIDHLLIDFDEWLELGDAPRRAVLDWARHGGVLNLYAASDGSLGERRPQRRGDLPADIEEDPPARLLSGVPGVGSIPFPDSDDSAEEHPYSLGRVVLHAWDGRELPDATLDHFARAGSRSDELGTDYMRRWTLSERLGSPALNRTLIFALLFAFAVVVAPLNLFVFAGKGRRHRLFVTTPLISVAACLLLVATIFLSDGLGGRGLRAVYADLQPGAGEMRLHLVQEQVSRTGVMTGSGFESQSPISLEPVRLPRSPFAALDGSGRRSSVYRIDGDRYRGDLFPSRSEQGFVVRASEPTRSRLELRQGGEGAGPTATSNLPAALTGLFYRDAKGSLWRLASGDSLAPGTTAELEASEEGDYRDWLGERLADFSESQRKRIRALAETPGRFFADVADPAPYVIETHPRVRWEESRVLLGGTPLLADDSPPRADSRRRPSTVEPLAAAP